MAEPKSQSDPRDQEQAIQRRPYPHDPTRVENERVSDASTINNGGLGGGRPGEASRVTPERARTEGADEPADAALPADDATLNTKI